MASQDPADAYAPVVQLFFLDNSTGDIFFDCTGTLINPRTVITAAHCVNFLGSEDYNSSPLGFTMLVSTGPNTFTRLINFANFGFSHAQGGVASSVDVIVHPASNLENFGLPFPFGDVAMIALAEPITSVGRMDLLLSPMPGPYHATIAAYGGFGTGSTGDVGIGFNRIVGENNVDMLGSFNDLFTATLGVSPDFESQNLYWIDMDDPNRPDAPVPCTNGAGVLGFPACSSLAAFNDINWFGGDALPREAGTAGGDSGSALIIDQAFARKLVGGVLSGGWNWEFFYPGLGVPGGYGDQSYYNPLYLFHEFISQNTPYKYVSAKPGGGDWDNPATWTQQLDPGFFIINGSGALVNGIPAGAEPGVGGTLPKWGEVQGTDISGFDPTPNPGLPFSAGGAIGAGATQPLPALVAVSDPSVEGAGLSANMQAAASNITDPRALANLVAPSSPLIGPGSTNFVPMNTFGTPGTAFQNPAQFFEVWLNNPGTVTLSSLKDIDRLELNAPGARLWIRDTGGDLLTVIESMVLAGRLTVDGNLFSPFVGNLLGTIDGHGDIISPLVQNFGGRVAPGNSIGTLNIVGNFVQGVAGLLEIEVTNGSSDRLAISGNATLAGTLQVKQLGAAPLDGQIFRILTTGGTRTGTFGTLDDQLPGLLFVKPVIYGSNYVDIEIDALLFAALAGSGPVQTPVAGALDSLGGNPGMAAAINGLQLLDPSQIPAALEALNPTRANAQAVAGFALGDILREQLGRRGHDLLGGSAGAGDGIAQMSLAGAQLASSDPTAEMLASAAAAAAAAEGADEAAKAAASLPNGYGLHFAGDFAWTKTDQPGAIGEDEADVQALTGGLDYNDGKGSVMGAALSYLTAEVDQIYGFGGQTESDGLAISAFGATRLGKITADIYGSVGWLSYDTTRRLLVAPATFANAVGTTDSVQAQAGANFSAELASHSSLRLSAIGGLHYIGLNIDGYAETGAGALSAVLPDREIESLKGLLGAQIALRISSNDSIVPFLRVQWAHEFSDDGLATSAAFSGAPTVSFTSPGPELGEDWATLGAGFSGRLSSRTSVYLRYQGDFGRDGQDNHGVSAAARFAF